ncbi:MAG: DNA polymerase III subunit epsilon [Proteobacteria bacterium]|nr:DNA polymerase III subunit epsilon [Pseudomonadota bacterium]
MRQIILDTETTGLSPEQGHRIIEIGCVELINRRLTGKTFHTYLQPDRQVDEGAMRVHGITDAFLQDKPRFKEIVEAFKLFIQGAELIIHNAPFDVGFIENEFLLLKDKKWQTLADNCSIFDTLTFARQKHPGQRNNLDALCKRYNVDNQHREKHGALLDAEILADVYLAMTGGQETLILEEEKQTKQQTQNAGQVNVPVPQNIIHTPLILATEQECQDHEAFLNMLEKKGAKSVWRATDHESINH